MQENLFDGSHPLTALTYTSADAEQDALTYTSAVAEQETHSPPSHTHPRSRSRTPGKDCVEDEWNGIIAFLKQLPDDPFDAEDACGRMKTKLGFSRNRRGMGRCAGAASASGKTIIITII